MAVEKTHSVRLKFYEKHCLLVATWNKNTNNIHTGEKVFAAAILLKVCEVFMRSKFIFLYLGSLFDEQKFKLIMKNSSSKGWLCFCLFLWRIQKYISVTIS